LHFACLLEASSATLSALATYSLAEAFIFREGEGDIVGLRFTAVRIHKTGYSKLIWTGWGGKVFFLLLDDVQQLYRKDLQG